MLKKLRKEEMEDKLALEAKKKEEDEKEKEKEKEIVVKKGDWFCTNSSCGNHNYAKRVHCNRCGFWRGGRGRGGRRGRGGHRGGRGGHRGGHGGHDHHRQGHGEVVINKNYY